jgi:hypothetical protein
MLAAELENHGIDIDRIHARCAIAQRTGDVVATACAEAGRPHEEGVVAREK